MADKHIFSKSTDSDGDRVAKEGGMPRVSDTLVGTTGAPDPDHHPQAAANADTDTEAGAGPELGGRTEPLNPRPR